MDILTRSGRKTEANPKSMNVRNDAFLMSMSSKAKMRMHIATYLQA
jgi:hypothetical protein